MAERWPTCGSRARRPTLGASPTSGSTTATRADRRRVERPRRLDPAAVLLDRRRRDLGPVRALPLSAPTGSTADPAVDWTSDGTAWAITIGHLRARRIGCVRTARPTTARPGRSRGRRRGRRPSRPRDHLGRPQPELALQDQIYVTWHHRRAGLRPPADCRRRAGLAGARCRSAAAETTGIGYRRRTSRPTRRRRLRLLAGRRRQPADPLREVDRRRRTFATPVRSRTTFATPAAALDPGGHRRNLARVYVSGGAYRTAAKDLVYAVWTDLSGESGCTTGGGPGAERGLDLQDAHLVQPLDRRRRDLVDTDEDQRPVRQERPVPLPRSASTRPTAG